MPTENVGTILVADRNNAYVWVKTSRQGKLRILKFWSSYIMEKWKDIWGYTGLYQVSNHGRIKSLAKSWISGNGKHQTKSISILKQSIVMGYKVVTLCKNGISKSVKVHRLVGKAFIFNPKNKLFINHKKGNKFDNRSWMLEWNTSSENSKHAFKLGLRSVAKGENCNLSKLALNDVLKIRKLILKQSQTEIAKIYNVSQSCISHIINNKNWKR